MSVNAELLKRFQPLMRYDSNEQFFADSAAQYCENAGNTLRRGPKGDGALIAAAVPEGNEPKLTLAFLGAKTYGNGAAAQKTDVIGVLGRDYRTQYVKLRTSHPDLNNIVYGRAVKSPTSGRLWLQYWFWYFYNDYQLALGVGTHEGDWEMVQLRMAPAGDAPDVAVYAQHKHGEKRSWEGVEKVGERPAVYVARGSHASYFEAGFHQTEAFYDLADGVRRPSDVKLEIIDHEQHAWMNWPGRWGDSAVRDRAKGIDQSSPTGPAKKAQWREPDSLLDDAVAPVHGKPAQAPDVAVTRSQDDTLQLAYDFSAHDDKPRAIVLTINSRNEKGVPPMTHTFEIEGRPKDTIATGIKLARSRHYDVYTSTVAGSPPLPSASRFSEIDPVVAEKDVPFTVEVAKAFGGLLATIRGDR